MFALYSLLLTLLPSSRILNVGAVSLMSLESLANASVSVAKFSFALANFSRMISLNSCNSSSEYLTRLSSIFDLFFSFLLSVFAILTSFIQQSRNNSRHETTYLPLFLLLIPIYYIDIISFSFEEVTSSAFLINLSVISCISFSKDFTSSSGTPLSFNFFIFSKSAAIFRRFGQNNPHAGLSLILLSQG